MRTLEPYSAAKFLHTNLLPLSTFMHLLTKYWGLTNLRHVLDQRFLALS